MAAVAPAQYEARTVNLEYNAIRDEKLKAGLALEKSVIIKNLAETEVLEAKPQSGNREEYDSPRGRKTGAGVANPSNGKPQSDDAPAGEELSDAGKSSVGDNDGSDKTFSEADSVNAEEWGGGSVAADGVEVEVANRNNCMLVFSHQALHGKSRSLSEHSFCLQDEEHDPSEEYEEYMACAVCGDNCKL